MRPLMSDSLISGQPLYLLYSYSYLVAVAGAVPLTVVLPTQATGNVRLHVTGNPPTTRELGFFAAHPIMLSGTVAARPCNTCRRETKRFMHLSGAKESADYR